MNMTIDTLEYVQALEAAGVERKAAEAHAKAQRNAVTDQVATKRDLDAAIAGLETTLIKYMVAQTLGIVGLILPIGGLLARFVLR
jgi:hypothetical protein